MHIYCCYLCMRKDLANIKNSYTIKRTGNLRSLFFKIKTLRSRVTCSTEWASQAPLKGVIFKKCNGAAEGTIWVLHRRIWGKCILPLFIIQRQPIISYTKKPNFPGCHVLSTLHFFYDKNQRITNSNLSWKLDEDRS